VRARHCSRYQIRTADVIKKEINFLMSVHPAFRQLAELSKSHQQSSEQFRLQKSLTRFPAVLFVLQSIAPMR
jgi:hypothetical protein